MIRMDLAVEISSEQVTERLSSLAGRIVPGAKGVIDLKDILLYLSYVVFFLFLTYVSLESKRWRTR